MDPKGQPLVIIRHRDRNNSIEKVERILSCLNSKHVYLTAEKHDKITADTQAVTHAAFLSMGAAWAAEKEFPWRTDRYLGGIENVKINVTLRIYSNKWHVYAGLAILNPAARVQIKQYSKSVTELFKLMLAGKREELSERVHKAGKAVFAGERAQDELLLDDKVLDRFSLGELPKERVRNNHLSLLAMVDSWASLGIVPYEHMICSTPVSLSGLSGRVSVLMESLSYSDCGWERPSICSGTRPCCKRPSIRRSRTQTSGLTIWSSPSRHG